MITQDELKILEEAKQANPHWFTGLLKAASIMQVRRQKYSGVYHPYFNFVVKMYAEQKPDVHNVFLDKIIKIVLNIPVVGRIGIREIFRNYLYIKVMRFLASLGNSFPDESDDDTAIDLANYALLWAGWILSNLKPNDIMTYDEWKPIYEQLKADKDV